jgi:ribosomal protein L11 methylase PrmA
VLSGVVTVREFTSGVLVRGTPEELARVFRALVPLQPVEWTDDGLVCAPDGVCDPSPLPTEPCPRPTVWPDSPAAFVAGWYRRSDVHAPAPSGVRELVQSPGTGFGPGDHPTTAMCLAALEALPRGDAVDVGRGSGLLAQAWARLGGARVLAIDADPAAITQALASLRAAGLSAQVEVRRQRLEALDPDELAGRVVLANVPPGAHRALQSRIGRPPAAVVASGLRTAEAPDIVAAYRRLGLRRVRAMRRRRFECHVFVGTA